MKKKEEEGNLRMSKERELRGISFHQQDLVLSFLIHQYLLQMGLIHPRNLHLRSQHRLHQHLSFLIHLLLQRCLLLELVVDWYCCCC